MDVALCLAVAPGEGAGVVVCPNAGVAAAAANVTNRRNSRRCAFMPTSLWFARLYSDVYLQRISPDTQVNQARLAAWDPSVDHVSQRSLRWKSGRAAYMFRRLCKNVVERDAWGRNGDLSANEMVGSPAAAGDASAAVCLDRPRRGMGATDAG